jgi:putative serine protease PepD
MSERPGHGDVGARGTPGRGYSAIPGGPAAGAGIGGESADANGEQVSEFGKFDWFTEFDDFGRTSRPADTHTAHGQQIAPRQPAAEVLHTPAVPAPGYAHAPGDHAADGLPAHTAAADSNGGSSGSTRRWWRLRSSRQWGAKQRELARRGDKPADGRPADGWREGGLRRLMRRWRLALAALGLATACTVLGGVLGGYVALRTEGNGLSDSSYSLGSAPPTLTNRPASSVAGIAARDTPAVVMIKVNEGQGTGSGFLIQGGYIVTDNHVVTLDGLITAPALRVFFSNGQSARGEIVGHDPYSDIAVIKAVGVNHLPALTLGNSHGVAVGDPVIAIGSPLGLADTVTSGIVSAVDRPVQPTGTIGNTTPQAFFDAIQTDAPINPGNSGGPLVNARGQVIGVDAAIDTLGNDPITGTQGGSIGLGFAIPMDPARRVIEELIQTGHATHSVIGAAINENFDGTGAQVMAGHRTVTPGGPAAEAGLRPGDVIIKVGSQPITNADGLMDAIRSVAPGSRVAVTFLRQGQTHQTTLTLGSASF